MLKIIRLFDKLAFNKNNSIRLVFNKNDNSKPVFKKNNDNNEINGFHINRNGIKYAKKLEK